jgi:hypothetical protein
MVTITGQENIEAFALRMLYIGLKFEARSGMKMGAISAVKAAKAKGYKGRTAKALIADMLQKHPELAD